MARFGTGLASLEVGAQGFAAAVTLPIAFVAGLLSFLSPCVLPLIPAYIGYLSGTTVADHGAKQPPRRRRPNGDHGREQRNSTRTRT